MEEIPLSSLYVILVILIMLSGFFSSSETGLMAMNKYRLRHLANEGHRGARIAQKLLQKPDRLIGLILLGNNLVKILAASIDFAQENCPPALQPDRKRQLIRQPLS